MLHSKLCRFVDIPTVATALAVQSPNMTAAARSLTSTLGSQTAVLPSQLFQTIGEAIAPLRHRIKMFAIEEANAMKLTGKEMAQYVKDAWGEFVAEVEHMMNLCSNPPQRRSSSQQKAVEARTGRFIFYGIRGIDLLYINQ